MIKALLVKDFILSAKYLIFSIIFGIVVSFAFSQYQGYALGYVVFTLGTAYLLIYSLFTQDEQSAGNGLIVAMPFSRGMIVICRYLLIFASFFASTLLYAVLIGFNALFPGLGLHITPLNIENILLCFFSMCLFISLSMPLLYKFGLDRMRFMIMIIFAGFILLTYQFSIFGEAIPTLGGSIIYYTGMGLCFLAASCLFSIRIFNRKDI